MKKVLRMKMHQEKLKNLQREHKGVFRTAALSEAGIPRTYLALSQQRGEIERVAWGVYVDASAWEDEMYILQLRFRQTIFSHETALYLHGLSDRTPLAYSITVPTGYNSKSLRDLKCKIFSIKASLFDLGCVSMPSPHGQDLRVYDLERTLCDVLRSRSRLDVQIVNDAIKGYIKKPEKNLPRLMQYAEQFGIQKIVRQYVEVLL